MMETNSVIVTSAKHRCSPLRCHGVQVEGDTISYDADDKLSVGVYMNKEKISAEFNYFEVEIVDTGSKGAIAVGLIPKHYRLDRQPGWDHDSVGYHTDDGKLFVSSRLGRGFGPTCHTGDRIGCGVKFNPSDGPRYQSCLIFFTKNGKEIGSVSVTVPAGGLYPAVGLHSVGEQVRLLLDAVWLTAVDDGMMVDGYEDDWFRLHDVRLNSNVLEYTGAGSSITDVGLAQAKHPLDTTNHYYEIEIVDPGVNCYISVGLTRKGYPKHRHPGWNQGSIAYHADDGKIFVGRGTGDPFGPTCHQGDTIGCGILFPLNYEADKHNDSDGSLDGDAFDNFIEGNDDLDMSDLDDIDELIVDHLKAVKKQVVVQVFFTRNGQNLGRREVALPRGGFLPSVGMMSCREKVKVDLHPLSG